MADNCRQHYDLATGKPLTKTPGGPSPGYKKGGKVAMKRISKGGSAPYKKGGGARGC
jgi:hypothetical protein